MPSFIFTDDSPEGKRRRALIESLLPKKTIVEDFLQPRLMESMNDVLIKALKQEIEIYKAYPKKGQYEIGAFDPRTTGRCFMGQGFQANGVGLEGWYDGELQEYRQAIGTMNHAEWGNATLLEIWGGDHFKDYPDMVTGVMKYAWGEQKTMPEIHFYINPFFKNNATGQMILTDEMKDDREQREHLAKLAAYIEIRDRLKKAKMTNPLNLALDEKDDPKGTTSSGRPRHWEEEDDE